MSTTANKAVVQRFVDQLLCQHRLDLAVELFTDDFVDHDADSPEGRLSGADGARAEVGVFVQAFPDMHVDIDALVAEDDLVFMRGRLRGTHQGELPGDLAATGRRGIDVWAWQTFRLVDGKIAEAWLNIDRLSLLQQVGAAPAPASTNEAMLRQAHADFARGDVEAYLQKCSPEFTFHVPGQNQMAGTYRGHDRFRAMIGKVMELTGGQFEEFVEGAVANEEHGVVLVRHRFPRNGQLKEYQSVHVYNIRDGALVECWEQPRDPASFDDAWA